MRASKAFAVFVNEINEFWHEVRKHQLDIGDVLELVKAGATFAEAVVAARHAREALAVVPEEQRIAILARVMQARPAPPITAPDDEPDDPTTDPAAS